MECDRRESASFRKLGNKRERAFQLASSGHSPWNPATGHKDAGHRKKPPVGN